MTKKFRDSFQEFNKQQAKYVQVISGRLGATIGGKKQVEVESRNSFVWVRLRETQNELIQAFNEKVSPVYDLPVVVRRRGNTYYIEGRDTELYGDWGDFSSYLPRHGNQHSFNPDNGGGGDITFIFPNQMMPALAAPSGTDGGPGLLVYGYPYMQNNGNWMMIGITGTPNIAQHKPTGNTAIMALVYIDQDSGNPHIIVGSGTHFAASITGSAAVLPYIPHLANPNTQIPLTAVRLVSGTSVLVWENLYDVRQWIHTVPSGTGGGAGTGTAAPIASGTYVPGILTPNRIVATSPVGEVNTDDHLYFDESGNVLIVGANSVPVPGSNSVHVVGSGSGPTIAGWSTESGTSATAGMPFFGGFRARGSLSAPSGIFKNMGMVRFIGRGHDGGAWSNTQAQVLLVADENWDASHHGAGLGLYATPTGTTTQREVMHVYGDGNVDLPQSGTYNVNGSPHRHKSVNVLGSTGILSSACVNVVPPTGTYYMIPFLNGLLAAASNYPWPVEGTLSTMYLRLNAPQPASGSLVVTLVVNDVDTALSITVPAGDATQTYTNTSASVSISAGDRLRWKFVNNATSSSPSPTALSMKIEYP